MTLPFHKRFFWIFWWRSYRRLIAAFLVSACILTACLPAPTIIPMAVVKPIKQNGQIERLSEKLALMDDLAGKIQMSSPLGIVIGEPGTTTDIREGTVTLEDLKFKR